MKLRELREQKGFTIIEVMIVLAIAGVIIAAVLVAVPQLQKNQRNSSRRAILARVKTEIDNFSSNNNGVIPTADSGNASGFNGPTAAAGTVPATTGGGFYLRYIASSGSSFTDPNGSMAVFSSTASATATPTIPTSSTPAGVIYRAGATCSGETLGGTGSARQYAVAIGLEGGAIYCLDNR